MNYENFLKATNKAAGFIAALVQYRLYLNRLDCTENVFYVDSTPVSVCENRYISSHKVMKGLASRGKSTKGWFFGFKLQGICTADGTVVRLSFRPGKEHDSQPFADSARSATGMFRHFLYSISAFLIHLVDDVQKLFLPFTSSVAKLEF